MNHGLSVLTGLKLTKSEYPPRGSCVGFQFYKMSQRIAATGVFVGVVENRSQEPPARLPLGIHGEGLTIELDRFRKMVRIPGRPRLRGQIRKRRRAGRCGK